MVDGGFVLEPSLSFVAPNQNTYHITVGKSRVNEDELLINLDYTSEGYYVKAGIGHLFKNIIEPTFHIGYSRYTETGKAYFEGPYYGDLVSVLKQKQESFFAEIQSNVWIRLGNKLFIVPNGRITYLFKRPQGDEFPTYHVPGAGIVLIKELHDDESLPKSNYLTGGLSVKLIYKLL